MRQKRKEELMVLRKRVAALTENDAKERYKRLVYIQKRWASGAAREEQKVKGKKAEA